MDHEVYVVKCPDYEQAGEKVAELLAAMGGMERLVAPGEQIVLKVNLLLAAEPGKAVTTHPAVVAAVGRTAREIGAAPVIADSPGSGYAYSQGTLNRVYRVCGMQDAAEEAGIEVNHDTTYQAVSFPDGDLIKRFGVITIVDGKHKHAQIDDGGCIRCYCCHEMCPENAIALRPSLLYRIVNA
jgi:uncharacterized protein (DUF362 family)